MRNWHPTKTVSNEDKLAGYALFKQATIGDCNIPAPGVFNFTVQVVCACDSVGEGEVERLECSEGFGFCVWVRNRHEQGGGHAEVH